MKILTHFAVYISVCYITVSCQKPLEPENNLLSSGTLSKDSSGNCRPVSINGIYRINTALNSTHYLDVSINVNSIGRYEIATDAVDGIHFGDSAQFITTGLQVVRLKGYGIPVSAGLFSYSVRYGSSSSCAVAITVVATGGPQAAFTLTGDPGACTAPVIQGNYSVGITLDASNKLILAANVTSPGDYTLSTPVINGISFSAAGTFSVTGNQSVTLSGSGIPLNAGTNQMLISGSATSCSFPLSVTGGAVTDSAKFIFLSTKEYDPTNTYSLISLTCYNPDKSVKWKRTQLGNTATQNGLGTFSNRTPSIEYVNGIAYYCVDSMFSTGPSSYFFYNFFYAIDVNTGNDIWKRRSTTDNIQNPIVRNGVIYCNLQNSSGNNIAAFDAANGNLLWSKPIPEKWGGNYLELDGNLLYYISSLVDYTSVVNAFDITTKTIVWQKNIGLNLSTPYSKMVNTAGLLILTTGTRNLLALNKTTGTTVWSKPNFSIPIFANNLIYAVDYNHVFHAFAPADGSELYQWPASLNIGSSPYVLGNDFYFTGYDPSIISQFIASYKALSAPVLNWTKTTTNETDTESPVVAGNTIYAIRRGPIVSGLTTYKIMMFDRNSGIAKDSIVTSGFEVGAIGLLTSAGKYIEPNF